VKQDTLAPDWVDESGYSTEVFETVIPEDGLGGLILRFDVFDDDGMASAHDFLGLVQLQGSDLASAMEKGLEEEQEFVLKADETAGAKKKKYNDFVGKEGDSALVVKLEVTEQVQVECVQASGLRAADKATSDPYCKVFWNDLQIHQTKVIKKELSPNWAADSEKNLSKAKLPYAALKVEMYDKDTFTKNDFHGEVILRSDAFSSFRHGEQTHALCPRPGKDKSSAQGSITLDLQVLDRLRIHVVNAMSLSAEADKSLFGKAKAGDPYVKVFHNGSQLDKKTKHKAKTTEPVWDEYRETYVPRDCSTETIRFEIYDHDMINMNMGKDETLGVVELDGVAIQSMFDGAFKPFKLRKDAGSRGQDIQMGWLGIRFLIDQQQPDPSSS